MTFGTTDCEQCGSSTPLFCDCKPIWQRFKELYAGTVSVYFRSVSPDGALVVEGKVLSHPNHEWHKYVKKLYNYPAVEFKHKGQTITVSRMPVSELTYLFDDDEEE